jgi:imidazolonepropionase-like amidohydrolase
MSRAAIVGGQVFTPKRIVPGGAVLIEDAKIIGVDDRKGSLEAGKDADVVLLDAETLEVEKVFLKGAEIDRGT